MIRTLIRLRADRSVGRGHLARCLPLAASLRSAGCEVTFAMEASSPFLGEVADHGLVVRSRDAWSVPALREEIARHDVAVLDVHGLDTSQVSVLREAGRPLVGLSAVGGGIGRLDLLVNPVAHEALGALPRRSVATGLRVLSGADAVIVDHARLARARDRAPRSGTVVVSFGGGDAHADRRRAAARTLAATPSVREVAEAGGPSTAGSPSAGAERRARGDFPALLATAEVVVCGVGTTLYEVAALGRPAIVVPQTPLHDQQARWLEPHGFLRLVDGSGPRPWDDLASTCRQLLVDQEERGRMSRAGRCFARPGTLDALTAEIVGLVG